MLLSEEEFLKCFFFLILITIYRIKRPKSCSVWHDGREKIINAEVWAGWSSKWQIEFSKSIPVATPVDCHLSHVKYWWPSFQVLILAGLSNTVASISRILWFIGAKFIIIIQWDWLRRRAEVYPTPLTFLVFGWLNFKAVLHLFHTLTCASVWVPCTWSCTGSLRMLKT